MALFGFALASRLSPSVTAQDHNTLPLPVTPTATETQIDFGLAFINSAESPSGVQRIQRGIEAGAQMDRFPIYWDRIEFDYANFNWEDQDKVLRDNEAAGLSTLALLLGTPGHYRQTRSAHHPTPPIGGSFVRYADAVTSRSTCDRWQGPPPPAGLFNPIFADGTDLPAPAKSINGENPWARFVHAAVNRYRPGGSAGLNVSHWEIWNEQDLCHFWSGTAQEYARLLKVAYLVIKQSDPGATVMWGGLAHFANGRFLYDMINAIKADPMAAAYNGFFDAAASHHYSLSWHGYDYTNKIRNALIANGWGNKPIWITESGVPVCNDYPGPDCPSPWRATPEEQAAYIWQNVAYTRLAGGGPIFHFMLHDDCGNEVRPDSPDGFGIVKNESSSFCSPANAERRPGFSAFQLATQYFPNTEVLWGDVVQGWTVRRVSFYHPASRERRLMLWSIVGQNVVATVPATGSSARLLAVDGSETILFPSAGVYTLPLPGATNRNWPDGDGGYNIGIYGLPYLLIEEDTAPPVATITPLPTVVGLTFPVRWQAQDLGSGVASVSLWARADGEDWQLWLKDLPASGSRSFIGVADRRYQFAILATDRAGNALNERTPQAQTTVQDKVEARGSVIDPRGRPVVGVEVTIGSVVAQTDEAGIFSALVPIGSWDIFVAGQRIHRARSFGDSAQLMLLYSPLPNVIQNGDFEAGMAGWQIGGSSPLAVEQQANTGDHALRLGTAFVPNPGVPGEEGSDGGNSTVAQQISVPTGHPYLAFAYKVESQEVEAGHDRFEVIIVGAGQPADYRYTQETASAWRYRFLDLGAYAGETVTLIFNLYQSSPFRPTSVTLDMITVSDTTPPANDWIYLPLVAR
ncbi:MAG: hypothetical protein KF893_10175 [Caldilineaceae bacterium]|nr:hypothetical protein [Caldilineaceae bacterium]